MPLRFIWSSSLHVSHHCFILCFCLLRFANAFSYYGLVLLTTELFQEGGACGSESPLVQQTPSHTQGHSRILNLVHWKRDNVVQWLVCWQKIVLVVYIFGISKHLNQIKMSAMKKIYTFIVCLCKSARCELSHFLLFYTSL